MNLRTYLRIGIISVTALMGVGSASANSYCYDDSVGTVIRTKDAFVECDASLKLAPFDVVFKQLSRTGAGYEKRVVSAMRKLDQFYASDLHGHTNVCVQKLAREFDTLKVAVLDGLMLCAD